MTNENKTKPTSTDVTDFLATLPDEQAKDSQELVEIMSDISGKPAVMWGANIIGFDSFHYKGKSGREGDWPIIGFAPRKGQISLYVTYDADELTSQFPGLGTFKIGKGCIYIKKLADVDKKVLREMTAFAYRQDPLSYYA